MTELAFPAPPPVRLPVVGSETLCPVRRVYCIGRNYAAHAIEMGHDPDREDPFFFQKNPDNLTTSGVYPYPGQSADVHHEVELAAILKSGGRHVPVSAALEHVFGYALALDMTCRDLQGAQKKLGRPWEIGKAFEHSAPIGPIYPADTIGHPTNGRLILEVNGALRQEGDLNQMIWKLPEIIAYLSQFFELAAGDVILTGTPSGVGPVQRGDLMRASLAPFASLEVEVV